MFQRSTEYVIDCNAIQYNYLWHHHKLTLYSCSSNRICSSY